MSQLRQNLKLLPPAARNTLRNARTSVVVTVAVLPSLLTQVMAFFTSVPPLAWIIIWTALMAVVFAVLLRLEYRAQPQDSSGAIEGTLTPEQYGGVTQLVAVVSNMDADRAYPPPIKTLIRHLPSLRTIYTVTCSEDNTGNELRLLREWVTGQHRDIEIHPLHVQPSRREFNEATADDLATELALLPDRDGLVVDITPDSKVMTLLLYLAALREGLPVTFMAARGGHTPGEEFLLQAVRDPHGTFTHAPATA